MAIVHTQNAHVHKIWASIPSGSSSKYMDNPVKEDKLRVKTVLDTSGDREHTGDHRFVQVQDEIFEVPADIFHNMSLEKQDLIGFSRGWGLSEKVPIILSGPTLAQFKRLAWVYSNLPAIDIHMLTLDNVIVVAELSYAYSLTNVLEWSMQTLASITNSQPSPLRTVPSHVFVRMLKLAMSTQKHNLVQSIQVKWITRIHWHELSPVPALLLADQQGFRHLLSHAYYVHLVALEPELNREKQLDARSPLSPTQHRHLLSGFYSLQAYYKRLSTTAPAFSRSEECPNHMQCVKGWDMRWAVAMARSYSVAKVDVLNLLRVVQKFLEVDMLLSVCLTAKCRLLALKSVAKTREDIASNLHHHFDL